MLNNPAYPATSVMELALVAAKDHTFGKQRIATSNNAFLLLKGITDGMELISQLAPQGHIWTDEQKYLYASFNRMSSELANGLTCIINATESEGV